MYDGTNYKGFQTQAPSQRSIQGTVTAALSKRFRLPISTTGASRTDTGVHARGNCIHFDAPPIPLDTEKELQFRLNQLLPHDIRIFNTDMTQQDSDIYTNRFHAMGSANGKLYTYTLCTNNIVDPLRARYCAHFYRKFDLSLFKQSLQQFAGTHDFVSFANKVEKTREHYADCGITLNTTRTIHNITMDDLGDGYYRVNIHVQSALNRMLRNVVGASLHVAEGKMDLAYLQALLEHGAGRDSNPAAPAPPEGLVLEQVYYDDY